MSDFAKNQLEKYGWQEGKGLGKEENGIAAPIKTKYKFDTHGIGHNSAKEYTSTWWNYAYNKAAKSINVINNEDGVRINTEKQEKKNVKIKESSKYKGFIKAGTLDSDGAMIDSRKEVEVAKEIDPALDIKLTDEELFSSCGGRTAHKGARFGLTMKGKLKRLLEQEKQFLNKDNDSVSQACGKKKKKKKCKK